jgi:intracellular multiplication protein IcmL
MANDALELIRLRNNFYRDNYRRVMLLLIVALVVVILLIGTLYYQISQKVTPRYFATTSTGQIIPLTPLGRPNLSNSAVLKWAARSAVAAYNYNFVNYRENLQAASAYFTDDAWRNFLAALKSSGNLEAVIKRRIIVTAVVSGAPVIQGKGVYQRGVIRGRYVWKVQVPLIVSYQGAGDNDNYKRAVLVTLTIARVSTISTKYGIQIIRYVAQQRGG